MKKTPLKRKTPLKSKTSFTKTDYIRSVASPVPRGKVLTKKTTLSPRARKMAIKRQICESYDLPIIQNSRWGTKKTYTRLEILKGMLWHVFSLFIRNRDAGTCISCGRYKTFEELQAGHYVPAGGNDLDLCFDENNVNGECEGCNGFDSFHLVPMRKNLVIKYGEKMVERLDDEKSRKRCIVWTEQDYADMIKYYIEKTTI